MSWVVVFDGNDPIVVYYIFVWNNNANVSCSSVNSSVNSWLCVQYTFVHVSIVLYLCILLLLISVQ